MAEYNLENFWAYDVEVLPNVFTFMAYNGVSGEIKTFIYGMGAEEVVDENGNVHTVYEYNDLREMSKFVRQPYIRLVGFNSRDYDDVISLRALSGISPNDIYLRSKDMIDNGNLGRWRAKQGAFMEKYAGTFDSVDLMQISASPISISLKEGAGKIGSRVKEFELDFKADLTPEGLDSLIEYNKSDIIVTWELFMKMKKQVFMRLGMVEKFGINAHQLSDSHIGNALMDKFFEKPRIKCSPRPWMDVWTLLPEFVGFTTELKDILSPFINQRLINQSGKFYLNFDPFTYRGTEYQLGVGGLHSVDPAGSFYTDDDYVLRDYDFASYYPNMLLRYGFKPEHLPESFMSDFQEIVDIRLKAKGEGDKVLSDGLKIVINGAYGKTMSKYSFLYDPRTTFSITITGQLILLMLIERMEESGIHCISANTDGAIFRIPRKALGLCDQIIFDFCELVQITMEATTYSEYHRLDVNNYVTVKTSNPDDLGTDSDGKRERLKAGDRKHKGRMEYEKPINKSHKAPIVAKAVTEYLISGTPLMNTMMEEINNPMMWQYVFKAKREWKLEQEGYDDYMGRVVRYFIGTNGKEIVKVHREDGREIKVANSKNAIICNEEPHIRGIDIKHYLSQAEDLISQIKEGGVVGVK